jgi:hypothetical protein
MATALINPNAASTVVHAGPRKYTVAADGTVTVDDRDVAQLLAAGFKLLGVVCTTGARPIVPAGTMVFDSTLGKPIWRNAAGTGWVDATGTAA